MNPVTSRERGLEALSFRAVDRIPKHLGGMRSSGIGASAYPRLVQGLGLPPRRVRIYESRQMLALIDLDVLEELGRAVVTMDQEITNAVDSWEIWRPEESHPSRNGQPIEFTTGIPKHDVNEYATQQWVQHLRDEDVERIAAQCRLARASTDKAVPFVSRLSPALYFDTHEATAVAHYRSQNGGIVFNCVRSILAEIAPEQVIAEYVVSDRRRPTIKSRKDRSL